MVRSRSAPTNSRAYPAHNNSVEDIGASPRRILTLSVIELTESEVLERIRGLYGRVRAAQVQMDLQALREQNRHDEAGALLYSYTHRMYDLSEYMKMLMQRFTQSYNRRHGRRGTLWEDRFKSILVEGSANALSTMAAYIDRFSSQPLPSSQEMVACYAYI